MCRCAVFRSHHVETDIGNVHNCGISLSNTSSFNQYQIIAGGFDNSNSILDDFGKFCFRAPGSQGAHINSVAIHVIHTYTVAEQRPAGPPLGWISRKDCHGLAGIVMAKAKNQFIQQRTFACAASPRQSNDRRFALLCFFINNSAVFLPRVDAHLGQRYHTGYLLHLPCPQAVRSRNTGPFSRFSVSRVDINRMEITALQQVIYHSHKSHFTAVFRIVDALDPIFLKFLTLIRPDNTTPSTE